MQDAALGDMGIPNRVAYSERLRCYGYEAAASRLSVEVKRQNRANGSGALTQHNHLALQHVIHCVWDSSGA